MQRRDRPPDNTLRQRLVLFCGQILLSQINIFTRIHLRLADGIPQRAPQQSALEDIAETAHLSHDKPAALPIQKKSTISVVSGIGENKGRAPPRGAMNHWCLFFCPLYTHPESPR